MSEDSVFTAQKRKGSGRHQREKHPMNFHIGKKIKVRRIQLGMSQDQLGDLVGVSFQQIQKYETGANSINVSRLFDISRALAAPMSYFFSDIPDDALRASDQKVANSDVTDLPVPITDPTARRKSIELVRNFHKLSADVQEEVYIFIRRMAGKGKDKHSASEVDPHGDGHDNAQGARAQD